MPLRGPPEDRYQLKLLFFTAVMLSCLARIKENVDSRRVMLVKMMMQMMMN